MKRIEVVVVGAGPAGIVTAIAARRLGLQATVLDARTPPIDKPCGEGILPQGVAALRALGIFLPPENTFPFRGIRFVDKQHSARADFVNTTGLSIRRIKLHQFLVDCAIEAGVEFLWGTRVTQFENDSVYTTAGRMPFRWLVGADGQNSQVRKWVGLESRAARRKRFGFCTHFHASPWSDDAEVYWTKGCQIFITPLAGSEVGVAVLSRDPALRLESVLPQFPFLAGKLGGAARSTREIGDTTRLRILPTVVRGRVALVGDASGTVDALTGHGLSLSFQQAIALAESMKQGNLNNYQCAHRKIRAIGVTMTRLMLLMDGNDWIRRKSIRMFQQTPGLLAKMLAIHTQSTPLSSLGLADIAGFGWEFLRT
jgi:flavin-dependent dehydrogenase